MRLGIDLDNCALDFQAHWVDRYYDWFGEPADISKLNRWDGIVSATRFADEAEFFRWAGVAHIWKDMPYTPGAEGFLDEALTNGHQVVFLTARTDPMAVEQTRQWFLKQVFANPRFYRFPAELRTNQTKKSAVPCGLYVDDAPHVLTELQSSGKTAVTFDRPWNQDVKGPRVKRWSDFEITPHNVSVKQAAPAPLATTAKAAA